MPPTLHSGDPVTLFQPTECGRNDIAGLLRLAQKSHRGFHFVARCSHISQIKLFLTLVFLLQRGQKPYLEVGEVELQNYEEAGMLLPFFSRVTGEPYIR